MTPGRDPLDAIAPDPRAHHLAYLDGYRAIAAVLVLVTHVAFLTGFATTTRLGALFGRFDFGVAIFFLLSGFLLYRPWAAAGLDATRRPAAAPYLWRRFLRVIPAYWLLVVVVFLVLPEAQQMGGRWSLPLHLGAGQVYPQAALVEGLTHTWSLATEITFYLALPLIGLVAVGRRSRTPAASQRRQAAVLALLFGVGVVWTALRAIGTLEAFPQAGLWLPQFLDWFAAGMAFALVREVLQRPAPPAALARIGELAQDAGALVPAAVILVLLAATPLGGAQGLAWAPPWTIATKHYLFLAAAALLLAPGFLSDGRPSRWRSFLGSAPMAYLGRISYGIFLWHLLLIWAVFDLTHISPFTGGFVLVLLLTATLTVPAATASWILVERPAMRLRDRGPGRRARRPARTATGSVASPGR